jgi:cardiolipin synthase (CMP-forming)
MRVARVAALPRWRDAQPGTQDCEGDRILTIPNLLSFYRLAAAPVAVWMALEGWRDAFFVLVIISLVSDLVDGPIARFFGQGSGIGARLDTIADACTLLAGLLGLYVLEGHNFEPELAWLFLFLASYAAAAITALVKFGTLPAYHLYLSKAGALCAGVFFVWLYLSGFSRPFFLVAVGLGFLANVESLIVTLCLARFRADIGSLFSLSGQARDDKS